MSAIFKRELGAYFSSPVGYVVIAAFALFSGIYFYMSCLLIGTSSMYLEFQNMFSIILFIIPIITMRTFSEDKKTKTDQALLTSPIGVGSVVFAKYLAAVVIFLICLSTFIVQGVILSFVAQPDWSIILGTIFGMTLMGSVFIAIGMFISSLTESMVISAVASFAVNILISNIDTVASTSNWDFIKNLFNAMSFNARYNNFSLGILSLSDMVFFVTLTAMMLFLTDRVIERRRWA